MIRLLKTNKKIPLLFALLLLYITACKKTDPSADPCLATNTTAQFTIYEQIGDSLVPTTNVVKRNDVIFKAIGQYDSVQWQIGNDVRLFKGSMVRLNFPDATDNISIKMTGYKKADPSCTASGVQSSTQLLKVYERDNTLQTCGRFKGYIVGAEADTFTVSISYVNQPNYQPGFYIRNFPKGCVNYAQGNVATPYAPNSGLPIESTVGYNAFELKDLSSLYGYCSPAISGFAQIQNNQLTIKYHVSGTAPEAIRQFIGIRQ